MGDTQPLTSTEPFVIMEEEDSVSIRRGHSNKPSSSLSYYNSRLLVIIVIVAVTCFLLSLFLFIGTVAVFFGGHAGNATADSGNVLQCAAEGPTLPPRTVAPTSAAGPQKFPTHSVTTLNGRPQVPGALIYSSDDFNNFPGGWDHQEDAHSAGFYYYVNDRNNSFVRNGTLFLKPTFTADAFSADYVYNGTLWLGREPKAVCVNKTSKEAPLCWKEGETIVHPIRSAMVTSQKLFSFKYGLLQITAKMPAGDWTEPLMTLQPNASVYGDGNGSPSGQIQMIDIRGNRKLFTTKGVNVGSEQNCPDIRWGYGDYVKYHFDCQNTAPDSGYDADFHTYEILWTPDQITLSIDGEPLVVAPYPRKSMYELLTKGRTKHNHWVGKAENPKMAPFDQEFFLMLGVNVGGTNGFFHDDFEGSYPKPWTNQEEGGVAPKKFWEARHNWEPSWRGDAAALQIRSIRLYALNTTLMDD